MSTALDIIRGLLYFILIEFQTTFANHKLSKKKKHYMVKEQSEVQALDTLFFIDPTSFDML